VRERANKERQRTRSELGGRKKYANVAKRKRRAVGNDYDSSGKSEKRPIRNRCDWKWVSGFQSQRIKGETYKRQFRNDNPQGGQEVDDEIGHVVVCIVGTEEEEHDGHAEEKLLGRGVLVAIVDLFPHVEIVVGTGVELERNSPHPVKHEEGAEHVADVGKGPRGLL